MDEDTLIEVKVISKDDESNPTNANLPMVITLGELRDWLISELDGVTEPSWAT